MSDEEIELFVHRYGHIFYFAIAFGIGLIVAWALS